MKWHIVFHTSKNLIAVDLINPPKGLKQIIQKCFSEYTEGTNPEFIDADKLAFLDLIRRRLYRKDFRDFYKEYAEAQMKRAIEDDDDFDLDDNVRSSCEFASASYDEGFKPFLFRNENINHHDIDRIHKTLCQIISAVMDYEPEIKR